MKKRIERKTADAVLQKSYEVEIGGQSYEVAPPSIATLILVSEIVSEMPEMDMEMNALSWSLKYAKDCKFLGDIIATLMLGAKKINEERKEPIFSLFKRLKRKRRLNVREELSKRILEELTPEEVAALAGKLLERMEIGSFFFTINFLREANILKATTTASGQ